MNELAQIASQLPAKPAPAEMILPEAVMPPHVAAVVPFKDHDVYGRLSLEQKQRVSLLLQIFGEMATAPDGVVAASERLAAVHSGRGLSASNLKTLYYKFRARGWRALAKIYATSNTQLPADFVQELKRRIQANKRDKTTLTVIEEIKQDWAAGKPIPGYGTWVEYFRVTRPLEDVPARWPFGFYPPGWGRSNLYSYQPSKAQRVFARRGWAAMKRYIPHVVRDTSALRPLELITIDDFELDFLVLAFNPIRKRWELCRCAGLVAQDVATRRVLALALVPRFKLSKREREQADARIAAHADLVEGEGETKEEQKRRISITRQDVQSLLHAVFSNHGRPADYGCTILCENASAAITPDFELALELLLGVQVARTGLIEGKTLTNGFTQGGGKPWEKGWLESLFRTAWNRAGALPGQKGASYQDKPADHEAAVAYAEKLLAHEALTPEQVAQLRLPFLKLDDALVGLNAIFSRIEQRPDHKMIGFEQHFDFQVPDVAGLLTQNELATLAPEQVAQAVPVPRRETSLERWNRLITQCRRERPADYILACLLLTPKRVKLSKLKITFSHGGTGYTFFDPESPVCAEPDGTELLGYFDPQRPGTLHVTDLKNRYLGAVRRRGAVNILDHVAISHEAGDIMRLVHRAVVGEVRDLAAAENAQLAADDAHNVEIQRTAGIAAPISHVPQNLPAPTTLPSASRALPNSGETVAPGTTGSDAAAAPARAKSLSQRLASPLARDAFAARGAADLARGIAADVAGSTARQTRADALRGADGLQPEDLL